LRDVEKIMDGKVHNKVLATQPLLSQRARGLQPDDPEQWPLYAAATLLSGMVVHNMRVDQCPRLCTSIQRYNM
jgi:hypothetical protein